MNTTADPDRVTLAERYSAATDTADLTVKPYRCDADLMLAAGYATAGNTRGTMALNVYRMKVTGDRAGMGPLIEDMMSNLIRRGVRSGGRDKLSRPEARYVAETVLRWYLDDNCRVCTGRRYDLIPGTQITSASVCQTCAGTGRHPLEQVIKKTRVEPARWLASELDALCSYVLADMARKLRAQMDGINLQSGG